MSPALFEPKTYGELWGAGKDSEALQTRWGQKAIRGLRTKFLILDWEGTARAYAFARFQFGEARKFGTIKTLEGAMREVVRNYQESADENVPLVIVMEEQKVPTKIRKALFRETKITINSHKTDRMKRLVTIPRILVIQKRHVDRLLFGDRDLPAGDRRELERQYAAQTCGLPVPENYPATRVLCVGAWVNRHPIAIEATPKSFRNDEPTRFL